MHRLPDRKEQYHKKGFSVNEWKKCHIIIVTLQ